MSLKHLNLKRFEMAGRMRQISFSIFCILLTNNVQSVTSADQQEIFASYIRGMLTSYISKTCSDFVVDNTASTSIGEWCTKFDLHKDFFLMDDSCTNAPLNEVKAVICDQKTMPAGVQTLSGSQSTTPHPVTTKVPTTDRTVTTKVPTTDRTVTTKEPTTDRPVAVTSHSGVTNTPKPVQDSTQTNVSVTPTARHGVTNTIKNVQVRATHRPCVFCGGSRITSVGWLFVTVLVYLVNIIS